MSFITLMYHEIREKSSFDPNHPSHILVKQGYEDILPSILFATLEQFEEQMAYLKKNNYHLLTLQEIKDYYDKKIQLPEKSIHLTFDDCYQSMKKYAYPILKKYGFPATAFVVSGWLWDKELEFQPDRSVCLSEEELSDISDVFEYANHTDSFHQRSNMTTSILMTLEDEYFEEDLDRCNGKDYVIHKDVFAYPFGLFENRNITTLQRKGFSLAFTSEMGINLDTTDPLLLKRNVVPYHLTMDNFVKMITNY